MLKPKLKAPQVSLTIWLLTLNDIFTWGIYYIVGIFSGIYVAQLIDAEALKTVGVGTGIAFITRGVMQIPIGIIGDKLRTEKDEVVMLMIGNLLMGLSVVFMTQIRDESHYIFLQVIFGIGGAFNQVDWRKLFAKNLGKGREGLEVAVYGTAMSFAIGLLSILSSIIASTSRENFDIVILTIGFLIIASNLWVFPLYIMQNKGEVVS